MENKRTKPRKAGRAQSKAARITKAKSRESIAKTLDRLLTRELSNGNVQTRIIKNMLSLAIDEANKLSAKDYIAILTFVRDTMGEKPIDIVQIDHPLINSVNEYLDNIKKGDIIDINE